MKVKPGVNMLSKLEKLYDKAGFNDLLKANDLVALKVHFGERGTPECDCCGWNEVPIVSDIGILASTDPIALDQACVDLVNKQKGLKGSRLDGQEDVEDKFGTIHKGVDWRVQLEYGEKIGLGTRKYQLIQL